MIMVNMTPAVPALSVEPPINGNGSTNGHSVSGTISSIPDWMFVNQNYVMQQLILLITLTQKFFFKNFLRKAI